MKLKIAVPVSLIAGLTLAAAAGFAAPIANSNKTFESGTSYHSLPAGSGLNAANIDCYNNPSDICISNQSNQTVNFYVAYPYPSQPVSGPLSPPQWVDAFSYYTFNQVFVSVTNAYGQVILSQYMPNHSIINITNGVGSTSGKDNGKLKVTVHS